MSADRGRILVIRGGAIGDFILTLPVLAALRSAFPRAQCTVLGYPHVAELAVAAGLADAVKPLEGRNLALFFDRHSAEHLPPAESAFFAGFDVILSYLYDPDRFFENNVRRASQAQFIAGPHRPDETAGQHATEVLLEPLQRLAIFDADPVPRLGRKKPRPPAAPPCLAVHPGSGSPAKNWPLDRWQTLLTELAAQTPARLLLVGGEAEAERVAQLADCWPAERRELALRRPLTGLADRLRECDAFLGHDSGITHLAAAVGLPGLALWGPSREAVWRPRSERFQVLRAPEGLAGLSVARVRDETLALLARARAA